MPPRIAPPRSSRRHFLRAMACGTAGAGVLLPLWKVIADTGSVAKAYPDELLSLDAYTRGRIKAGDEIHAGNVEHVRNLLDPIRYEQVAHMGRRLKVAPTTTD